VSEVHVRPLRLVFAVAILACAFPAHALAASATIVAVENKDVVRQAKNPNDDIVRCRMYWGKTATVRGLVTKDDGTPAAGVTLTLFRQFADPTDPTGYKTVPVGQPLVTDAQGRWERKVKPDRITYYYVSAAPQPELGIAAQTVSPQVGLMIAPRLVQTSDPRQKGASFKVTGRVLMAGARSYGRIVVERLRGQNAERKGTTVPNADGTFLVKLRHDKNGTYRYRLSYRPLPKYATRLIASSVIFSITVTSIKPEPPDDGQPTP
jgi:hypothetical protein